MKKKININKNTFIYIFATILIIFFEPQIFKEESFIGVEYIDLIYKILKGISFLIVLIFYLYKIFTDKSYKISKTIILITVLQFIMFISTIINSGSFTRFIGPAITTIVMALVAEILIKEKKLIPVLKKVNSYFIFCYLFNLATIFIIDVLKITTYTNVYFLGIDNRFIFTLLQWIVSEGIISIVEQGKLSKRWVICVLLSEILLLYKFSVAAMILFAFFIVLYFINDKVYVAKYSVQLFITYLILNILFVVCKIQNLFTPILNLLKKDSTLSGRTFIWDGVMGKLLKNPILGNGMQSEYYDEQFFFNSSAPHYLEWCRVPHAHNSIMTLLYRGGLASASIYLYILYYSLNKIKKYFENPLGNLLIFAICIIMFLSIFDTMDFAGLYFIITIAINIKYINKIKNE